jgi:ATP-dependent DNA ligase
MISQKRTKGRKGLSVQKEKAESRKQKSEIASRLRILSGALKTQANLDNRNLFRSMLAKLVRALPEGPGWSFEVKFDGYGIEAIKNGPEG